MIKGMGTDIVEISRIAEAVGKVGFLEHVYTPAEIELGRGRGRAAAGFWAGRWAAKEALAKALGCGVGAGCALNEVEIVNDRLGAPVLGCVGAAAASMRKLGADTAHVSISHTEGFAVATVILEGV